MTEIVPFQDKRKKQFSKDTSPTIAVLEEIEKHFKKNYKALLLGDKPYTPDESSRTLGNQPQEREFSIVSFSEVIASVTSPTLLQKIPEFTLSRLEAPQFMLTTLAKQLDVSRPYHVLPKPYRTMLKRVYMNTATLASLAVFLDSKKKAKKYLRILHKKLGIFTRKKPPFVSDKS